jgi:hypothetical protein
MAETHDTRGDTSTSSDPSTSELRVQIGLLRERVDAVERAITVFLASLTGLLLLGGAVIPFGSSDVDEEDVPLRLITAPFEALGYRDQDGDVDTASTLLGLALLLLLAVTVSAILVLFSVLEGSAGRRAEQWAMTTGVLLVLGVGGLWVLMGMGLSNGEWSIDPGMALLTIGAIAFALLTLPASVRSWWRRS